jgi:hypothetical protein
MTPIKFLKNTRAPNGAYYSAGELAGFPAADAAALIASGAAAEPTREDLLPIPDGWQKLSAAELRDLASRIADREVKDAAGAKRVIEAELDARLKAAEAAEAASASTPGGETKAPSGETKPTGDETKTPDGETKPPGGEGGPQGGHGA